MNASTPLADNAVTSLQGADSTLVYFLIGTLGAVIWDILSNINTDYHILRNFPIRLPMVVYFISRIMTFVTFLFFTIMNTRPFDNCHQLLFIGALIAATGISSTTLLFFLRVRAIFQNKRPVVAFFFFSWLAVVAGCIFQTQNGGKKTGAVTEFYSGYCASTPGLNLPSLVTSIAIIPMINDTFSFVALTWRLVYNSHIKLTLRSGMRVIMFGHYLPAFSKALLQDGQVYFLTTVTLSILSTAAFYSSTFPRQYSTPLVFPNIAIMNLMGCRLYRNTKLGIRRLSDPTDGSEPSQPMVYRIPDVHHTVEEVRV